METEVRSSIPDLPSSADIARLARSPSALLNHLSTLAPEGDEAAGGRRPAAAADGRRGTAAAETVRSATRNGPATSADPSGAESYS